MRCVSHAAMGGVLLALAAGAGHAGTVADGYRWLSETDETLTEAIVWNDRLADGEDRWKTGGATLSMLLPEGMFWDGRLVPGHASALEIQGRGLLITPDNTQGGGPPADRPFAQYVGLGAYLRTFEKPKRYNMAVSRSVEHRVGIEIGYQGDPLPLFSVQDFFHSQDAMIGPGADLDGEVLVNGEVQQIWRFHAGLPGQDVEAAPFVQASFGMRENSVRAGADFLIGSSLEGRTWNRDLAIGALIPGGAMPRGGVNWTLWLGGDVGYVGTDVFLDGGFGGTGARLDKEHFSGRVRGGIMVESGPFVAAYSLVFLSREFRLQPEGQVIGAVSVRYRF